MADRHAPLITVVTATYNALDGLRRTVDSVREQTLDGVEHVIVDGGSTDGTVAYLQSLGDAVRWVSEPDDGIADAMNKGVAMARGSWILVLQAGDAFESENAAEKLAQGDGRADIVSFDVTMVGRIGNRVARSKGFSRYLEQWMCVPHQGAFVKRTLFDQIGGFDHNLRVGMDYEFMLRAKRAGAKCMVVNDTVALMPADGISSRRNWTHLKARLRENRLIQSRHLTNARAKLFHQIFWLIYPIFKRIRHWRGTA